MFQQLFFLFATVHCADGKGRTAVTASAFLVEHVYLFQVCNLNTITLGW